MRGSASDCSLLNYYFIYQIPDKESTLWGVLNLPVGNFLYCLSVVRQVLKKEGSGAYVDETVITTKVKAALLTEKSLRSPGINVETF